MNDLISRQAAIDAIDKYLVWVMYTQGDSQNDEAEFVENIIKQTKKAIQSMLREELPSAQPEIVRCKDCKYWREHKYAKETKRYIPFCGFNAIYTKADDFCSRAERREE